MKTTDKAIERPSQDRTVREGDVRKRTQEETKRTLPSAMERRPNSLSKKVLPVAALFLAGLAATGAIVTGNLTDIGLQPLNTKLLFQPTNKVVNIGSSLNAGPAKVIDTTNGAFALTLAPGDYTVCLPLIPSRHCFGISVGSGTNSVNITNLMVEGFLNADDGTGGGNPLRPDL